MNKVSHNTLLTRKTYGFVWSSHQIKTALSRSDTDEQTVIKNESKLKEALFC